MSTEQERIEQYQRGWNDAMRGRPFAQDGGLLYAFGWRDANAGHDQRLTKETQNATH